jgi:CTP:molybdopterin cytidylyltransferase MocA
MSLHGDAGGRLIFSRYHAVYVPWHDPSLLLDVDTLEDYERLLGSE